MVKLVSQQLSKHPMAVRTPVPRQFQNAESAGRLCDLQTPHPQRRPDRCIAAEPRCSQLPPPPTDLNQKLGVFARLSFPLSLALLSRYCCPVSRPSSFAPPFSSILAVSTPAFSAEPLPTHPHSWEALRNNTQWNLAQP